MVVLIGLEIGFLVPPVIRDMLASFLGRFGFGFFGCYDCILTGYHLQFSVRQSAWIISKSADSTVENI